MHFIDLTKSRCRIALSGPDAARYLNGQISNDIRKCVAGNGIAACVCTAKGKLEGVINLTLLSDEHFLIDFPAELEDTLPERLDKYLIADDCEWAEDDDAHCQLHVIGAAPDQLQAIVSKFSSTLTSQFRLGQIGTDIVAANDQLSAITDSLTAADITRLSDHHAEAIRIRNVSAQWGAELDADTLPQEAGLEAQHISFSKGCYIGQETISRIKSVGRVNRSLVSVSFGEDGNPPAPGTPIFKAQDVEQTRAVGKVTSISPILDGDIATGLAYIHRSVIDGDVPLIAFTAENSLSTPIRILHTSATGS